MTMPSTPSLSAEERELALLLGQLDPVRQPSMASDASVLTMARRATAAQAVSRSSPPRLRRWPAAMGLAASLLLAVGIAWQVRPSLDDSAASSADAASPSDAGAGSGPWVDDMADMAAAPAAPEAFPAEPMPPSARPRPITPVSGHDRARDAATAVTRQDRDRSAPPPVHEVTADQIAEEALAPPAPIAAPTEPAPAPPLAERAAIASGAGVAAETSPAKPETQLEQITVSGARLPSNATPAKAASQANIDPQTGNAATTRDYDTAGFSTDAIDQEPPAKADTPQVQQAWLERIRALLARGEITAAQSSLAEFRRRYPGYLLPDDLARLAPPAPADP